mmetsp:Transcript_24177/g.33268  ORF Transcript_24177/g.33268 Transcript_24177/m.33268 type:complete len:586 (-) Transcript_24177:13-1770(-)
MNSSLKMSPSAARVRLAPTWRKRFDNDEMTAKFPSTQKARLAFGAANSARKSCTMTRKLASVRAVAERQREYPPDQYAPDDYYPDQYSQKEFSRRQKPSREYAQRQNSPREYYEDQNPSREYSQRADSSREYASKGYSPGESSMGKYSRPSEVEDEEILLGRSQIINKPVITRTSGSNLGVVSQVWVDVESWKVESLDLRENLLFGDLQCVLLQSVRQVGDVILVHSSAAIEPDSSVYGLLPLVGSEVLTEAGEFLGRVRDFTFSPEDGRVARLIFDAFGVPLLPDSVVSCYALGVDEVLSVGPSRILVREGAEANVRQLSSSLLQRLALAEPPWEEALRYGYYSDYDYESSYESTRGYDSAAPPLVNSYRREAQQEQYDNYYPAEEQAYASRQDEESRPQEASKVAKVRLYGPRKRVPANERRDVDGGFGDPTEDIEMRRDSLGGRKAKDIQSFDEWLEKEEREYVAAGGMASNGERIQAKQSLSQGIPFRDPGFSIDVNSSSEIDARFDRLYEREVKSRIQEGTSLKGNGIKLTQSVKATPRDESGSSRNIDLGSMTSLSGKDTESDSIWPEDDVYNSRKTGW